MDPALSLAVDADAVVSRKGRGRLAVYLLLLVTVNFALFLPSMSGDFLWDDKQFISENPYVQGSGFLRTFLISPFGGFSGLDENSKRQDGKMQFYRPLVSLSYWLDFKVWGLNSAAFHLTNILIHTLNVILLFYVLIGLAVSPRAGFFGALLFSAFPLHFENVAWISGRTDLLSFLFAALSALFFLRFLRKRAQLPLLGSAAAYFLGLLCKENIVFLPLIYLLILYKRKGNSARPFFRLWPYAMALVAWIFLRWNALGAQPVGNSGRGISVLLATIGFYGWRTAWPFGLSLTINPLLVFQNSVFQLIGGLLAAGFAFSIWQAVRKRSAAGWLFKVYISWMLLVLPSAAVIFSPTAISLLAWRFLYLPSAVLTGALAYSLEGRLKPRTLTVGAVMLLTALYAAEIYPKNTIFGSGETAFWLGIKNPEREDALARFNIGVKALPIDEKKALRFFDEILARPDHPLYEMLKIGIHEELAIYYTLKSDFSMAETHFNELLRTGRSQSPHFYFNYSYYLAFSGKREQGEVLIATLLRGFPRNHFVLTRAAKFYLIVQDYGKAAELYAEDYRLFRNRQSRQLAMEAAQRARETR